jgi:hypothetical protein
MSAIQFLRRDIARSRFITILAHNSSILYSSNSQLHLFLFRWHTRTQLKLTVLPEIKTVSLCFLVAHWHTTQSTVLLEFITVSLCFRVAHWHTTYVCFKTQIKNYLSFFWGGTLAHVSSPLYCSNTKLNLSLFRWHTGTQLNYIVQLEFKTVSFSFWVAHWHMT